MTSTDHMTYGTAQNEVDDLILDLLPLQGHWSEEAYLWLTDHTNRLVEFTDGYIEILPWPTDRHQSIVGALLLAFHAFVNPRGGKVLFAPLRVKIRPRTFREPDVLLVLDAKDPRRQNRFWLGADLALEVVSPDKPERVLVDKRSDYAEAGIPEYWIVNSETETITVLRLEGTAYVEHGVYGRGAMATSHLIEGFVVDVNAVFDVE